ncbi:MAG: hypothetical protein M1832_006331 [Thelocarpon impressellum]|nr:MAG: hypothetical protein M1832_006331 [Thelocarpon impressellum]
MAASSKSSVRASRRVAGLLPPSTELAAPVRGQRNIAPAPPARRPKRTRADESQEVASVKKQRVEAGISVELDSPGRAQAQPTGASVSKHPNKTAAQSKALPHRYINGALKTEPAPDSKRPAKTPADSRDAATATHAGQHDGKRQLRSQVGASRYKSDLALFFPCYDEMISNEPRTPEFISIDTPILVVEDENPRGAASRAPPSTPSKTSGPSYKRRTSSANGPDSSPMPAGSPFAPRGTTYPKLHNAQRLDFSSVEKGARQAQDDPLDEAFYLKAHRRAERREKQLRNIEKNKAQHEKDNLERLLEGLRGPDWLRVMGINGITESEKKEYENKRDFFVREVAALIEKFKEWKEEEKRRKQQRDQALHAKESTLGTDDEHPAQDDEPAVDDGLSDGDPPDYSDVDAWAARQLHQEAISATGGKLSSPWAPPELQSPPKTERTAPPPKPFTSFYSKPYQRLAAVGKHRRSGRSVMAFGRPLPDVHETFFELPPDILTPDAVVASARSRRRLKRESKEHRADEPN